MVEVKECTFCGGDVEPGTGIMVVQNDGARLHFCSSKCEKNVDLGRVSREVEWTEAEEQE
ncbi:MAG: 50S ribosomal protein L24e [Halobacteria archaeon]